MLRGAAGAGLVAVLLVTATAEAQPRRPRALAEPRVFITLGGGAQGAGSRLADRLEFQEHFETAVADIDYAQRPNQWLDGGVRVRLWRRVGAGLSVSRSSRESAAEIEARIPHPFFFEEPREIAGQVENLSRTETGLHLHIAYFVETSGRLKVILSAGPSRITTRQDTITGVRYTEEYPFDVAAFQRADTQPLSGSAVGFHAGADVAFMFSRALGVTGIVRFTRASMDLERPDNGRLGIDAGGVQAGAGLRVVF